jgi:hypothetical protein
MRFFVSITHLSTGIVNVCVLDAIYQNPEPAMSTYLENIEAVIGPAENLIVDDDTMRTNLIGWANLKHGTGMPFPPGVQSASTLTNVELANLYHAHGPGAKPPAPVKIDGAFARLVRAVEETGFAPVDVRRVMAIVNEAMRANNEIIVTQLNIEIGKVIEQIEALARPAPVRIELVKPEGVQPLEGLHHVMTGEVIQIANLGDPIMMVGPAGAGKTTIGEMTAKALDLPFLITSTVFDTHELMGFVDGHGNYHRTAFRNAFEHGGVWVADEIDAWDAAALLAANSALANGYVTFPDNQIPVNRHPNFRMIACANTFGTGASPVYIGRNQLDAASLDRFAMIRVDYDRALESALSVNHEWTQEVWDFRRKVNAKNIRHVVSTRAIIKGSRALHSGKDWDRVREIYLYKGMSEADRKKVIDTERD